MKLLLGTAGLAAALIAAGVPTGSLRASPAKPAAHVAPAGDVSAGKAVFLQSCSPCHGADANGDEGPALRRRSLSTAFIVGIVTSGVKGQMPTFGPNLGSSRVRAVAAYVRSLQ